MSDSPVLLQVGQQIDNGQIVITAAQEDGTVTVVFPIINSGTTPFNIVVQPTVTVTALENILNAILAVLPGNPK